MPLKLIVGVLNSAIKGFEDVLMIVGAKIAGDPKGKVVDGESGGSSIGSLASIQRGCIGAVELLPSR